MKKGPLFLISVTLLWGMIKLLEKTKGNQQVFTQREQEIPNQITVGCNDNEIASFLRASERKSIQ
jgi:DNA-binding NarL/FixJ family response regulator